MQKLRHCKLEKECGGIAKDRYRSLTMQQHEQRVVPQPCHDLSTCDEHREEQICNITDTGRCSCSWVELRCSVWPYTARGVESSSKGSLEIDEAFDQVWTISLPGRPALA